jgi:hypothetical protein
VELFTWIVLFSSSLLTPATHYNVPQDRVKIQQDFNAAAVVESTASVGTYVSTLNDYEGNRYIFIQSTSGLLYALQLEISQKRFFRVTEQTLVVSGGRPIFLGTKIGAPFQWGIISTRAVPTYDLTVMGSTGSWITVSTPTVVISEKQQHFFLAKSSTAVVDYTLSRVARTGEKYRIYKGEEYAFKDTSDCSYIKKKQ